MAAATGPKGTIHVFRAGDDPMRWRFADGSLELARRAGILANLGATYERRQSFHGDWLGMVLQLAVRAGYDVVFPALPPLE
jgi:hypothetical protein